MGCTGLYLAFLGFTELCWAVEGRTELICAATKCDGVDRVDWIGGVDGDDGDDGDDWGVRGDGVDGDDGVDWGVQTRRRRRRRHHGGTNKHQMNKEI